MIRLLLTAEGQTEQEFAAKVLRPHLADFGVQLPKPRCAATGRKSGSRFRGGVNNYELLRNDIQQWIKQDQDADARFTTMIDLYGLPLNFPGFDEAKQLNDPYEIVSRLEISFAEDINSHRFIPYIQLHEFEALLFAGLTELSHYYFDSVNDDDLKPLHRVLGELNNPELVDDGRQSAPSKRIAAYIPQYTSAKRTAGPIVAEAIGIETLRQACRHFGEWLAKLEALGSEAATS